MMLLLCAAFVSFLDAADVIGNRARPGDDSGAGDSLQPILSADGRRVVFLSWAGNIASNSPAPAQLNVYSRDLLTSNSVLVSADLAAFGAANMGAGWTSISSNGNVVAFLGEVEGYDSNFYATSSVHVFVRNLSSSTTRLLSAYTNGYPLGYLWPGSTNGAPIVTDSGRYVFFDSTLSNLTLRLPSRFDTTTSDTNGTFDVFRYDLQSNRVFVVSHRLGTNHSANSASRLASITRDGRRVAMISAATNLAANGATNSNGDVYVRDMITDAAFWVSPLAPFTTFVPSYKCVSAILSEGGEHVAVVAQFVDAPLMLFRVTVADATISLVASNILGGSIPQISSDGRFVAFEDGTNVYRWDGRDGNTVLVNVTAAGIAPTNGLARSPRMTEDGDHILFLCDSAELTGGGRAGTFQLFARDVGAGVTHLITDRPDAAPSHQSSAGSTFDVDAAFSRIVFDSPAGDLVANDFNNQSDVFLRDLAAGTTALVSRRAPGWPEKRTGFGHVSFAASGVSSNGAVIAFTALDSDLTPGDTNGFADAFVANVTAGDVLLAAPATSNLVRSVALSGDGRYAVLARRALTSATEEIIRFNGETHESQLLFEGSARRGDVSAPAVNFNGTIIGYLSNATLRIFNISLASNEFSFTSASPLLSGDLRDAVFSPDSRYVVFVRSNQLHALDRSSGELSLIATGNVASVSANSRYVAIYGALSYYSGFLYRWDLTDHVLLDLKFGQPVNRLNPSISGDGRWIAAEEGVISDGYIYSYQVVLVDAQTGQTNFISTDLRGFPGSRSSRWPSISADGRFVAYLTQTPNSNSAYMNRQWQVFVRDRLLGVTTLLSSSVSGGPGNASSSRPIFSADGHTLVFESAADNLVAGDGNGKSDVFVVRLGVDSDADGMDDDWEVTYFGNLSRNGSGDFDGDGVLDRDEFLGGTDPTNEHSAFRLMVVSTPASNMSRLVWSGDPRAIYRLQYKYNLSSPWYDDGATITWEGTTASVNVGVLQGAGTSRLFWRVVRE